MGRYAKTTTVSEGRSKAELEAILDRFGADEFAYGTSKARRCIMVGFKYNERHYRITVPMPSRDDDDIRLTPTEGWVRSEAQIEKVLATEKKRKWRVLCAYIKALVVGVEENVLTWEEALLPYHLMNSGKTVAEEMLPRIAKAIKAGVLDTKLLPDVGETGD